MSEIVFKHDTMKSWLGHVMAYVLNEAIKGKEFQGFKLVEGRSVRKYTSEDDILKVLKDKGFEENLLLKPVELLGITAMEKLVGKAKLEEFVGNYIVKLPGNPTLVPESDKRQAISSDVLSTLNLAERSMMRKSEKEL